MNPKSLQIHVRLGLTVFFCPCLNYTRKPAQTPLKISITVIEKINRMLNTDIENYIEAETIMDPVLIEKKTSTFMGSLYGTSSNSKFAAFFRPSNFTSEYKGLYFCGGTVHPGGGIPLCLKSAYITSEIIKEDYGK